MPALSNHVVETGALDVDVLTTPALARTIDSVAVALQTDALMSGATALTPKFAKIDAAGLGDNTIVAAVVGKKIRVVAAFAIGAGATVAQFQSGASGTALTGGLNLALNTGFVLPFNPAGWFETAAGALLNLNLSLAISVDGSLTYVEV